MSARPRPEKAIASRTVGQWWREIDRRFRSARLAFGHGTDNARDEAAWLLCSVLRIPFDALAASLEARVTAADARRLERVAAERISTRAPLAYILREAWLRDHRFYVDRRVIVPRSHIAELLPEGVARWLPAARVRRVLDLCTGSGCLAILAALAFPRARVDASDLSAPALHVARRNVAEYGLGERVRLLRSDLFDALGARRYDLIVTNPPYVPERERNTLPREYQSEPDSALFSGSDGLDLVRRILAEASRHLSERGVLVVEVGDGKRRVEKAFPGARFTWIAASGGGIPTFIATAEDLAALRQNSERPA